MSLDPVKLRSYFVKILLLSLVVAATAGIMALLFGSFGVLEGRVLATTLVVGVYSIVCLCCMTVLGSRYKAFGLIGMAASSLALLLGLFAIWIEWPGWDTFGQLLKYFLVFAIVGVSFGHQSLLLRIVDRASGAACTLVLVTVILINVVAALLIFPIMREDFDVGDTYWRLMGVAAILDVLGTITAPVLVRIGSKRFQ